MPAVAGVALAAVNERRAPWIEGGALALLVLLILLFGGEAVRVSYHGSLHSTIGEAVLRDGLLPENPYHAGAPLRYYTLYPALGAALGRTGLGPFWAFALLNVIAAGLLAPALDALGRGFGLGYGARRAAFLAAVLGFNALGWIGVLVDGAAIGTTPVVALRAATFGGHGFGWDARLQAFLPKFLNVSSFALALPFGLFALAQAARGARSGRPLRAGLAAAAALALNPLVGGFAGVGMAGLLAAGMRAVPARRVFAWLGSGLLAVVLALPFLLALLHRAPAGVAGAAVQLGGSPLADLFGPLLLLLPCGLFGLRRMEPSARARWAWLVALAALLVLFGEMPWGNEYKFARLGGLLWALPAGAWAAAAWRHGGAARGRVAAAFAVSLPLVVLVPVAYLAWTQGATPPPLEVVGGRLRPAAARLGEFPLGESLLAAEAAASASDVLLMHPYHPGTRAQGAVVQGNLLAPALHHALFADLWQVHNDREPDLAARLDEARALWDGVGVPGADGVAAPIEPAAALAAIRARFPGRGLLVLSSMVYPATLALLAGAGGEIVAQDQVFSLWRLAPSTPARGN